LSINIQLENRLQKISGQTMSKEKIISTLGYTPAASAEVAAEIAKKADKEPATVSTSGLMSAADKAKLDTVEKGAQVNVQSDWNQNDETKDDYIKNKITKLSELDNDITIDTTQIVHGEQAITKVLDDIVYMDTTDNENIATEIESIKDELKTYLDEELQSAIVSKVYELIKNGGVVGFVDENNRIVLTGTLAGKTYTVKYEMEDGSTIDIGDLALDTNTYYSVTNNLTNCTNSNSATEIAKGKAYNATISANSGYALKSVTVTMGGASVTVTNGVIAIEKVTGDIVITAVAEVAEPVTENLTLVAKTSIVTGDGSTRENTGGHCATDFIDVSNIPKPCTIKLEGAGWAYTDASATGYVRFYVENVSGTKLASDYTHPSKMPNGVTMTCSGSTSSNGNNYIDATITVTSDNIGKLRFAGNYTAVTPNAFDASVTKATLTYTPST
jgi:hypothetical protein